MQVTSVEMERGCLSSFPRHTLSLSEQALYTATPTHAEHARASLAFSANPSTPVLPSPSCRTQIAPVLALSRVSHTRTSHTSRTSRTARTLGLGTQGAPDTPVRPASIQLRSALVPAQPFCHSSIKAGVWFSSISNNSLSILVNGRAV